jgi:predicted phosphodiesterase
VDLRYCLLSALARLAPVRAVRGNNDRGPWAERLPLVDLVELGGATARVTHNIAELDVDVGAAHVEIIAIAPDEPR